MTRRPPAAWRRHAALACLVVLAAQSDRPTLTVSDAGGDGAAQQPPTDHTEPATTDGPTTTGSGPGLGVLSAVIALLATASLARRR